MDSITTNHLPELGPQSEVEIERSQTVEGSVPYFQAILSAEFRWDQAARPVQGAEAVINRTFLEMQPQLRESADELSA